MEYPLALHILFSHTREREGSLFVLDFVLQRVDNTFAAFVFSATVPHYWLTEGGQCATGALLDYIVENHIASPHLANRAASQGVINFSHSPGIITIGPS